MRLLILAGGVEWSGCNLPVGLEGLVSRLEGRKEAQHYQILRLESPLALTLSTLSAVAMNGNGKIDGDGVISGEKSSETGFVVRQLGDRPVQ